MLPQNPRNREDSYAVSAYLQSKFKIGSLGRHSPSTLSAAKTHLTLRRATSAVGLIKTPAEAKGGNFFGIGAGRRRYCVHDGESCLHRKVCSGTAPFMSLCSPLDEAERFMVCLLGVAKIKAGQKKGPLVIAFQPRFVLQKISLGHALTTMIAVGWRPNLLSQSLAACTV